MDLVPFVCDACIPTQANLRTGTWAHWHSATICSSTTTTLGGCLSATIGWGRAVCVHGTCLTCAYAFHMLLCYAAVYFLASRHSPSSHMHSTCRCVFACFRPFQAHWFVMLCVGVCMFCVPVPVPLCASRLHSRGLQAWRCSARSREAYMTRPSQNFELN